MIGNLRGGPSVIVKATGCADALSGQPTKVALAFHRFPRGGLVHLFVEVDTPEVVRAVGKPFVVEHVLWPGDSRDRDTVERLLDSSALRVTFVEPLGAEQGGACKVRFALAAPIPAACRDALRREWKDVLEHHAGVAAPELQACLNQYNAENPIEESPVLWSDDPGMSEEEAAAERALGAPDASSAVAPAARAPSVTELVSEALATVDSHVRHLVDGVAVDGAGSAGPLMAAVRSLERAREIEPSSATLHYAHCSALALAAQFESARREMEALAGTHPQFPLARWALAGWERFPLLFRASPWSRDARRLDARLGKRLVSCTLLPVREGIQPRSALFLRDTGDFFPDESALRAARIDVTGVVDRGSSAVPVVGLYARVWDSPPDAMNLEAHVLPLTRWDDDQRLALAHLCCQTELDFVVVDRADRVVLNRRLPIPQQLRSAQLEIAALLDSGEEHDYAPAEARSAIQHHQARYDAARVSY